MYTYLLLYSLAIFLAGGCIGWIQGAKHATTKAQFELFVYTNCRKWMTAEEIRCAFNRREPKRYTGEYSTEVWLLDMWKRKLVNKEGHYYRVTYER